MIRTLAILCTLMLATACQAQNRNQEYHAKIALENGAALPAAIMFVAPPAGSDLPRCINLQAFANGLVTYIVPVIDEPGSDRLSRMPDDKCQITIMLKGYRRATVTLYDGAVILLKQIGDPEGSTVSMTALRVPKDAAKARDKGIAELGDDKLAAAQQQFERAVALYPEYAQAWSDLGEVLEQQSKPKDAVAASEHALQADPKYIRPYLQLMRIAVSEKRMEDAAALGDRAMQLNPVEFTGIYYYDAQANYELIHPDVAEKMARQAIDLDKSHEYPAAEALLGKVLADKGDVRGALDHFRAYVRLAPKAADLAEIRQRIAQLEHSLQQAP